MSQDEIKQLIIEIRDLVEAGKAEEKASELSDAGAKLLKYIDKIVKTPDKTIIWVPKDYSKQNNCILASIFSILEYLPDVNRPFNNEIWINGSNQISNDNNKQPKFKYSISFYELAYSRCCSIICQLLGDRFSYIQKLLIKNLFGPSHVCSLLASDIYTFIYRIINPHNKQMMCQVIMNLNKMAPPESVIKGAALINRLKHPVVNFENPKYQYLLDL